MDAQTLYTFLNTAVLPAWFLMAAFPNRRVTDRLVLSFAWPAALAVLYAVFIVWGMVENAGGAGGMDSLDGLRIAFQNDKVLLAAWIHYLVFDLVAGIWMVRDNRETGISPYLMPVFLLFTLMLGPIGWVSYLVARRLRRSRGA